jgi:uncharacterized membrane protein
MDTTPRTVAKSLTWQGLGLLTGTVIGFCFTGSVLASGGIALTGAISGTVFYILHEKLWSRVQWGRKV